MPFTSKKQQRKCYALRRKGQAGSWDCAEFSKHTDFKKLPETVEDTAVKLGMMAARSPHAAPIKPIQPLPGLFQPRPVANSPQAGVSAPGTRPDGKPAVRTPAERLAPPSGVSMGKGPLNNGYYGAYGMRQPLINGLATPPTVANRMKTANALLSPQLSDAELEQMVRSGLLAGALGGVHPALQRQPGDSTAATLGRSAVSAPLTGAGAAAGSLIGHRLGSVASQHPLAATLGGIAGGAIGGGGGGMLAHLLTASEPEEKTAACKRRHRIVKDKSGKFVFQGRRATTLRDDPQYDKHMQKTAGGLAGVLGKLRGGSTAASKGISSAATQAPGLGTTKIVPGAGSTAPTPVPRTSPATPAPRYGPGSSIGPDLRAPPAPPSRGLDRGEMVAIGAGAGIIGADGLARYMLRGPQQPQQPRPPVTPAQPPQMAAKPPGGAL